MSDIEIPITRQDAIRRLDAFVPIAASSYSRLRNKDRGQGGHIHVSRLSAALRRRLITEEEVVKAVLAAHGLAAAEKYVSEVFWRTYWKGWLEQRPAVWANYLKALQDWREALDIRRDLSEQYGAAVEARTGIDCFDGWVCELQQTGYMHNWARMQFASIWIFTLGLPWQLGAAFMFDRLIDADPASNTLSWRWVAGLHTAGKAYLDDPERIRNMTDGSYEPKGLAQAARIPADMAETPSPAAVRVCQSPDPLAASLLLLTTEDLSVEQLADIRALRVKAVAVLQGRNGWDEVALSDALARAREMWPDAAHLSGDQASELASVSKDLGCTQVVTAFLPVGPVASSVASWPSEFARQGLRFTEYMRTWDRRAWPYCRKGFFGLKDKIPSLVQKMRD